MSTRLPNLAGKHCDAEVSAELESAGIAFQKLPEFMRGKTGTKEVKTVVVGMHLGWGFERGWTYWIAKGPGIPFEIAKELNDRMRYEVRIDGHGNGKLAEEAGGFGIDTYHIDTLEGLLELRKTLDKVNEGFLAYQQSQQ